MSAAPRIFLWAPEFSLRPGGIQQYTREVVDALDGITGLENVRGLSYGDIENVSDFKKLNGVSSVAHVPRALRGAAFAIEALRETRRFQPDVILSTFPRFAPAGVLCQQACGVPFVTAAHGIEVWGRQGIVTRRALQSAARILAVSSFTARRLVRENGIAEDRISILPNCVDEQRFAPGPKPMEMLDRLRIDPSALVLLTVARIDRSERAKGIETVLRALPKVRNSFPELVYVIAGAGSALDDMRQAVRELGLSAGVRFTGRVSEEELPDLYRMCDAFVMPSSKEGFGIVFLEAMATGKSAIAGGRDGASDALLGGELGWLVDPELPAEVAKAIVAALSGRDRRCEGAYLRQNVIRHFGREVFLRLLREEIFGVIGK